jgi:hypothetical protein
MEKWLIILIKQYQYWISPLIGSQCRFYPSCSHYAVGAIARFGFLKGGWLMMQRCLRCHPWHPGGEDPVPQIKE